MAKTTMAKLDLVALLVFLAAVVTVVALSSAGIVHAQNVVVTHLLVGILVLSLFIAVLPLLRIALIRLTAAVADDYSLDEEAGGEGTDNRAFVKDGARGNKVMPSATTTTGSLATSGGGGDKWRSSYVPYGSYPAGSGSSSVVASTVEANGTKHKAPATDSAQSVGGWRHNYVPYEEEENGAAVH